MTDARAPHKLAPLFTWRSSVSDSELPPTTRHCLLALSLYMNERGGSAFPGSSRLAHDTGYHKSTVKTALRAAYKSGWLKVVQQGGTDKDGNQWASEYVASTPLGFVPKPYEPPRVSWKPGVPEDSTRASWLPDPGAEDAPNSPVNTPVNSRAREGKCNEWTPLPGIKPPTVAPCILDADHPGPCEPVEVPVEQRADLA